MSTTNVPQIQWLATGLFVPSEAAVLAGVQADINAAFGGNLNFENPQTPQSQWAASLAAAISNNYANFAQLVTGVDPDQNAGFMQDAIGRIYFMNRSPGTSTVVECNCLGQAGTPIPAGSPTQPQAKDTSGNLYYCVEGGTIPTGGTISLEFANCVTGPIPCPAGTLTQIYQTVPGWDQITNPADGVVGNNVQSAESFEYDREQSVAANSNGPADAVYGAVIQLAGVTDAFVYENTGDDPITYGATNFTIPGHCIFVGVIGGAAADIGNAIREKKGPGCNTVGNSAVTVTDPNYSYPQPTYTYNYNNNAENPAVFNITVNLKNSASYPETIVQDVQAAVTAQFNGTLAKSSGGNGVRVRIASLLLAATFYGPVAQCEGPSIPVNVLTIFIGSAFSGLGTVTATSNVLTITTATTGSLTPGTPVTDADNAIPAGTYIVQQLTGTPGGVGTYQMSAVATSTIGAPEAITGTASGTSALIGIDQAPELGTVTVNLV